MARLIRAREVSPIELLEAHLARIEQLNPRLNAIVTLAPDALTRAREIESALMRGEEVGPLAGVPFTIKDTIETKGLRTTFGSRVFAKHVPREDAPAVARLKRAGAVIIGKSNAAEMALEFTAENPVFGRTNNPFDERLTPGGSSGGCAAAVCSCLSAGGLGSDLAGSLRIPAHFCGVAGLRPTTGRVPGEGHKPPVSGPFALGSTLGPIARRVDDLELFFRVLSANGENGSEHEGRVDEDEGRGHVQQGGRVAWYADDGNLPVDAETRRVVEFAAGTLASAKYLTEEVIPPCVGRAAELWTSLFTPATVAFLRETYAGRFDDVGPVARLLLERAEKPKVPNAIDAENPLDECQRLRHAMAEWMMKYTLIVAPVGLSAALPHGARKVSVEGGEAVSVFRAFSYSQAFNVLDLPAASVRAGWTDAGLPVGVQVVGRPQMESEVLAAARVIEEASGGWQRVPENLSKASGNPL